MSHSPSGPEGEAEAYHAGWGAVGRLIRRGWSWSGRERHCAFLNLGGWGAGGGEGGGGRDRPGPGFADVSAASGLDLAEDGRAAARVDWDFDGDQDLVVSARTAPRLRILRNEQTRANAFLALRLMGTSCNRDGIGARVEVRLAQGVGGGARSVLVATRRAGEGFLAQSSAWLHFGLGAPASRVRVEEVRVRWPGGDGEGGWESFGTLAPNRRVILVQGAGRAADWPAPSVPVLAVSEPGPPPVGGTIRVLPAAPIPMPTLEARGPDGRRASFFGITPGGGRGTGRAVLLTLWSRTCAPCARELGALGEEAAALAGAGVDLVALSVDPISEAEAALDFVRATGFGDGAGSGGVGTVGFAEPRTLEVLDALAASLLDRDERLGVPASFLVDGGGRLQALYLGPVGPEQVRADLGLASLEPGPRRGAAVPFGGRFVTPPAPADLAWLETAMNRRGLPRAAAEFALGRVEARQVDEAALQVGFGKARMRQEKLADAARHFERAVALDPYAADAWKGLGFCRHRLGDLAGAEAAYREAARLDGEDERTRVNLGLVLLELGSEVGVRRQLDWLRARESPLLEAFERRVREFRRR